MKPTCPYCAGGMEPRGLPQDRAWRCTACGRLHFEGAVSVDAEPRPPLRPPSWWGGATLDEVLALGLCGDCPGTGAGIPGLTDDELRRQIAVAASRLEAGQGSPWLRRWMRQLLDERRGRRGAA